jgi:hypothetical protein
MAADVFRSMFDTTCLDFAPPDPYAQQKLQMMAENAHVAGDRLLKENSQQLRLRKILIANKKKGFHSVVFGVCLASLATVAIGMLSECMRS